MRRQRGLPPLRVRHAVRGQELHRLRVHPGARLRRGRGTCKTVATSACDPFVCDTTAACKTTCAADADCVAPATCIGGSCGKKTIGTACVSGTECNSGFCAQGFCCNTACTGTCTSCALTGTVGTCTAVAAGTDPLNQCTDAGAASCGTDGTCNGNGACRLYASGTQCVAQSCTGSTLGATQTCDGAGVCKAATTSSCTPYVCGTGACKTTCTSNADCLAPNVCTGTTCGVPSNLKVQYVPGDPTAPKDNQIKPHLMIFNMGTTAVPYSDLAIKYWYTIDTVQTQAAFVDFAALGNNNVMQTFASVSPARTGADTVLQVAFSPSAGSIPASGNSGAIELRFNKTDFTVYDETNDYSYTSVTVYTDAPHITLYRAGTLVWGIEPP